MTPHLSANKVLKSLPDTQWSAHVNAINALQNGYFHISEVLISAARDINQPGETRNEALSLLKKWRN